MLVGLALLTASCASSDPIGPSVGTLTMRATVEPPHTGRFAFAASQLVQITLVPANEDPDALPVDLSLLATRTGLDLRSMGEIAAEPVRLPPGLYRIVSITVGSFALNTAAEVPSGSACVDGQLDQLRADDTATYVIPGETLGDGVAPVVQADTGVDGTVRVVLDGEGLVQLLESRYNCAGNFLDDISPELLAPLFSVN